MPETDEVEHTLGESLGLLVGLLRRRRWWIVASVFGVTLATVAATERLPNMYSSEATLMVVQQQVSQRYVEADSTQTRADTVNAISRNVLSRGKLLDIINEFGLYAQERKNLNADAVAELMRKDVRILPLDPSLRGDLNAFQISFTAGNPELAQSVTSHLTSLFIQENLTTRGNQAASTTNFLTTQLEGAKRKLAEQEQRVLDFKARYAGQLPDQQITTLSSISDLRSQLQTTMSNISRVRQHQLSLDASLREKLARLQADRTTLLSKFTPRHPSVVKKDEEIASMEALIQHLNGAGPAKTAVQMATEDPSIAALQTQVEADASDMETFTKEERQLRAEIAQAQGRMSMTPVIAQELDTMMRDYNTYNQTYQDLLSKQQQSQLTTKLEQSQQGEQFRLVDPPTLPEKPTSPNRRKLGLAGVGGGLALGLILAFFMDFRDTSFHSEKPVKECFSLPLVLAIPLLLTPQEERSRRWKRAFEWATAAIMTVAVGVAEFYIYRHG